MKNLLKIFFLLVAMSLYTTTLWVKTIEKFDIEAIPNKVKVWESVDITIKALDKDWNIVKDYVGEILIFSQSDPKAEFPWILSENTYKFKTSDAWVVKFENAVKFSKAWTQDINVYDSSDENVFWLTEVEVVDSKTISSKEEISINSPENWVTLWSNKVKVNWNTLKNHKVKIVLNTDKEFEAISILRKLFSCKSFRCWLRSNLRIK